MSLAAELLRALSPKTEAGYLMAPPEGTVFGARPDDELELVSKIGEGSFGTVWRAVHRPSHAFVAVKRVRLDCTDAGADSGADSGADAGVDSNSSDSGKSSSALKESAAMEQLTHENIVRFYAQYRFADCESLPLCVCAFPALAYDKMEGLNGLNGEHDETDTERNCG